MKEFTFQYFTATNSVAFDDFTMKLKIGPFIKREFPFQNLVNYYVFQNNQYRAVYFVYTDVNGKNKKVPVYSTPAEMGFNQLIAELQAKIPQKSLNHLSEKEAFAAMKVANPKKWAPIVIFLFMVVLTSAFVYPGLRHYFDNGFVSAQVDDVATKKDLGTRNIRIIGTPLDKTLEETTTTTNHGSSSTTKSVFIPLVNSNYAEGDPIKVILKFENLSDDEYQDVLNGTNFTGVIRDIAWEGIGNSQIDFFKTHFGFHFPETPVLVEITNQEHNDVYAIWVVIGISVFGGIIVLIAALKMR